MSTTTMTGLNLVAADMDAILAFYRLLGADIPDSAVWSSETGAHHVTVVMPGGFHLEFDSVALANVYNAGYEPGRSAGQCMLGFEVDSREAVDALYEKMTAAGHRGLQPPWDAFWGARACVVEDPDGRHVGIQSPSSDEHRGAPPEI